MRLWCYSILPYLPDSQLLAQKRECDLIWKDISQDKKTNHILINYIWEYEDFKDRLKHYYILVEKEFLKRNYKFKDNSNYSISPSYDISRTNPFPNHHNLRYLNQCYMNLQEKFDRGQRDFSSQQYELLKNFINQTKKESRDK